MNTDREMVRRQSLGALIAGQKNRDEPVEKRLVEKMTSEAGGKPSMHLGKDVFQSGRSD